MVSKEFRFLGILNFYNGKNFHDYFGHFHKNKNTKNKSDFYKIRKNLLSCFPL